MKKVHVILVLFAVPISLFSMAKILRIHHNYKSINLAFIGLSLLMVAVLIHDINFGLESSNIGHVETTHHGEAGHGHHEHGSIGETLETIFTVLGSFIFLGAHYLNID